VDLRSVPELVPGEPLAEEVWFDAVPEAVPLAEPEVKTFVEPLVSRRTGLLVASFMVLALGVLFLGVLTGRFAAQHAEGIAPANAVAPNTTAVTAEPSVLHSEAAFDELVSVQGPLLHALELYQSGLYNEASSMLENLALDHPYLAEPWLALGVARLEAGNVGGARGAADRVASLKGSDPRVHMLMASIHIVEKDLPAARTELKEYLALDPHGPFAEKAKKLLSAQEIAAADIQ
jgi:hypothetical protein